VPPTIHELLADAVMRSYYKTRPTIPRTLEWGEPWMVWATDHEGKWGRKTFQSYTLAWDKVIQVYRNTDRYRDVALVSRRVFFPPPVEARWRSTYDWCSRCRRPSEFRERSPEHHALRTMPVLTEDAPRRCYYCGIRRAAMPRYTGSGPGQ
jgi:DNA-directed RNA polymerase subunit RPC12/RpoP